jgi:phosphoenolpyruvate carboxylase
VTASAHRTELLASDSLAAHSGVVSESGHDALRADIRRLSTMLGRTVAHQAGDELLSASSPGTRRPGPATRTP